MISNVGKDEAILQDRLYDQPLLSIGMPVYNGEITIRRAIDSLLAQEFKNYELIISDNCSTDFTAEICKKYSSKDQRIKLIHQPYNIGIKNNFQAVLDCARGEYFMWAAVDDAWDEDYVKKLIQKLESNRSFAVAQSATENVSENNYDLIGYVRFNGRKNPEYCTMLQLTNKLVSPLKYNLYIYGIFRRVVLAEAFKFCPSVPSSDRWFLLQFPLAGYKFAYIDEPLYIRTIASEPLHVRYENDCYGNNIKLAEKTWFRFESLPAVRAMLSESTLVSHQKRYVLNAVMLQLFVGRLRIGFRLLGVYVLTEIVKPILSSLFPSRIVYSILEKRRRALRSRNQRF